MTNEEKQLSEQESLKVITEMIGKVKESYHNTGISLLLWGSCVFIASFITFLQIQYSFNIPFDIWFIVLFAIIPQVIISIKESKQRKFKSYDDVTMGILWLTYAITVFGLVAYQNIVPGATDKFIHKEGWMLLQKWIDGTKPDEVIKPFALSVTSMFLLVYAFPTLVTGVIKKFMPMIIGSIITYLLFVVSLYTSFKYDMICSAIAALVCWFIPGIILRKRYLEKKRGNV